jgi:hypothetical protein
MNARLRAAGHMIFICLVTLILNGHKIIQGEWIMIFIIATLLVVFAYAYPQTILQREI